MPAAEGSAAALKPSPAVEPSAAETLKTSAAAEAVGSRSAAALKPSAAVEASAAETLKTPAAAKPWETGAPPPWKPEDAGAPPKP